MTYKVPDNVVNKRMYLNIKNKIDKRLKKQGRRWSAYASGELVRTYKLKGGKYKGRKSKDSNLSRWYKEKWVDVCALPKKKSCGRGNVKGKSYASMKRSYPYCRPSKRVDKNTPKTIKELSPATLKRRCSKKRKSPSSYIK